MEIVHQNVPDQNITYSCLLSDFKILFKLLFQSASPWSSVYNLWPKPSDGIYTIRDQVCREFEDLISFDHPDTKTQQTQRHKLINLIHLKYVDVSFSLIYFSKLQKLKIIANILQINICNIILDEIEGCWDKITSVDLCGATLFFIVKITKIFVYQPLVYGVVQYFWFTQFRIWTVFRTS